MKPKMILMPEKKGIHVAIIMDGNRRWAQKRKKPVWYGHAKGAHALKKVSRWCGESPDVKTLTVYALSTENLKREKKELNKLWDLYKKEMILGMNNKDVKKNKLRINIIGNKNLWRADVKQAAADMMRATSHYTGSVLNILIAYGGRYEIINAARKLVGKGIKSVPLAEKTFNKFLMVNDPVDLVIRTGGEHRLSNFLLYQAAYAEIYFTKTLWPDFSEKEFKKILRWYRNRDRRIGR